MKKLLFYTLLPLFIITTACSDDNDATVSEIAIADKELVELTPESSPVPVAGLFVVKPGKASKSVEYTVSDTKIAKITDGALVYVADGETTIKAKATDESGVVSPDIKIVCRRPVTGIELVNGDRITITNKITVDLTDYFVSVPVATRLEFTVSNASVAKVEADQLIFVSEGTTTVTANTTDGSNITSQPITVTASVDKNTPKEEWTVSASSTEEGDVESLLDENIDTYWAAVPFEGSWVLLDMHGVNTVSRIVLYNYYDGQMTNNVEVYVSSSDVDGIEVTDPSFTKVGDGMPSTQGLSVTVSGQARYVYVKFTGASYGGSILSYIDVI